jgi:hypothetical protein
LEAGGFLVIEHMLYILEVRVNLLLVSSFEDGGYGITFQQGQVLISSTGTDQNIAMVLGVKEGRLYKLLSRPMIGTSGCLDIEFESDSCDAFFGPTQPGNP